MGDAVDSTSSASHSDGMNSEPFSIELKVRDYECDLQGIVNNSVYQNYLEHARHEFLLEKGVDFAALAAMGAHLVVLRAELDYKASLRPGDRFRVNVRLERHSRLRWAFVQDIIRVADERLMLSARILGASLDARGRPCVLEALEPLFAP